MADHMRMDNRPFSPDRGGATVFGQLPQSHASGGVYPNKFALGGTQPQFQQAGPVADRSSGSRYSGASAAGPSGIQHSGGHHHPSTQAAAMPSMMPSGFPGGRRPSQEPPLMSFPPLYKAATATEVLVEYPDASFDLSACGNISSFITAITPKVQGTQLRYGQTRAFEACFLLKEVWQSLRSPYGVTIPLSNAMLNPFKSPDRAVYYTPTLSAVYFNFAASVSPQRRAELVTSAGGRWPPVRRQREAAGPAAGDSSRTPEESEGGATSDTNSDGGNVPNGMFYAEEQKPESRLPLSDLVDRLARGDYPGLLSAKSTEFTHNSWFAVLWQPIFCQNHTSQRSAGSFLAYYWIRPAPIRQLNRHVFRCDRAFIEPPVWLASDDDFLEQITATAGLEPSFEAQEHDEEHFGSPEGMGVGGEAEGTGSIGSSSLPRSLGPLFGGAQETASGDSSSCAEGTHSLVVPVFAIVPARARCDIWYNLVATDGSVSTYLAPLFLIVTAVQLMTALSATVPGFGSFRVEDYYYSFKHDKILSDIASIA